MKNRKIIVDREELTPKDIKSNMDFDGVINRYAGIAKYSSTTKKMISGLSIGIVVVIIIITGIYLSKPPSKPQKNNRDTSNILSINKSRSNKLMQSTYKQSTSTDASTVTQKVITKSTTRNPLLNANMYNRAKYNSLDDYYKKTSVSPQLFTIMAARDTTIIGEQGTKFIIKAMSFVDSTNHPVKGLITIVLKECYQLEDMLRENLTTLANGKLLESGGMVYLEAKSGDKQLTLKKFEEIEMYNPIQDVMADTTMSLFYGTRKRPAGCVNWTVDNYSRMPYPIATLIGGKFNDTTSIEYFANKFRFAKEKMIESLKKKDSIEFSVSFNELIKPIGFSGGGKELLPGTPLGEFLNLVGNNYVPSIQGATWQTAFQFNILNKEEYEIYLKEYKEYINDENFKKGNFKRHYDTNDVFYSRNKSPFYIGKMGWVNCDRWYMKPMATSNEIHFTLNSETEEDVKLSFYSGGRPSIMKAMKIGNTWCFQNIPVNKEVTVTGTFLKGNVIQKASKTFKVQEKETMHQLEYKPVCLSYN